MKELLNIELAHESASGVKLDMSNTLFSGFLIAFENILPIFVTLLVLKLDRFRLAKFVA